MKCLRVILWAKFICFISLSNAWYSDPSPIITRSLLMFSQDLINRSKPLAFSNLPTARACSSLFVLDMISLTSKLIQFVITL